MIKEILDSPFVQLIFAVIAALAGIITIYSYFKTKKHNSSNQQNITGNNNQQAGRDINNKKE